MQYAWSKLILTEMFHFYVGPFKLLFYDNCIHTFEHSLHKTEFVNVSPNSGALFWSTSCWSYFCTLLVPWTI